LSEETLVLRPSRGLSALNLKDLWVYRELVYFLTWRDLKVRYKQTVLGAGWAILQPVLQMVIFSLIFGGLANIEPPGGIPYPIFNYVALLPWGLFSKAITDAGRSLVNNRNMITKIYFPRLVIPVASILAGVVDFAIAFLVLLGIIAYYNFAPGSGYQFTLSPALLAVPFFLVQNMLTALGVSLWFSAMNVIYRDVGYILPFLAQIWFYATPIVYPLAEISERWRWLFLLNPLTGVVEGFRWALLGTSVQHSAEFDWSMIAASTGIMLIVLITGLFYFRRMERTFADEI
jgi:lipopolysaccharide transport system permease protein